MIECLGRWPKRVSGHYLLKFLIFGLAGASGKIVHLALRRIVVAAAGTGFAGVQFLAPVTVMVWDYLLNNSLTCCEYRLIGGKSGAAPNLIYGEVQLGLWSTSWRSGTSI